MATSNNPLKVVEVCRVTPPPSSANSATPTSLPLTLFDVFWLRFPPTQRLFFYETSHPTPIFHEIVLPKLKHSLSLTLQHYLPLAGNLIWPPDSDKPIIQYVEGDAVSLTIAESQVDFHHLSSNKFIEAIEFHPFLPSFPSSDTQAPVLALQITLFPNTGFSIGIAAHHAVLDGKTTAMFMHSWSSICMRGGEPTLAAELSPFYDRSIIIAPADAERNYLNFWLGFGGPNNKSLMIWDLQAPPDVMFGIFHLTPTHIENLKKSVQDQWQEKHKQKPALHLSTFTVTSAYAWVCLVKARKLSGRAHLGFSVDCRARLQPPLPSTYFGACVTVCKPDADSENLKGEDGLLTAAKAICEGIAGLKDGVLKGAEDMMSRLFSVPLGQTVSIAGSTRFEMYKTDFGWGRPNKVKLTSIGKTGAFSLSDSRDGSGSIEIGVVLKKHEIEDFASLFASGLKDH